jgi:hypothetical protein
MGFIFLLWPEESPYRPNQCLNTCGDPTLCGPDGDEGWGIYNDDRDNDGICGKIQFTGCQDCSNTCTATSAEGEVIVIGLCQRCQKGGIIVAGTNRESWNIGDNVRINTANCRLDPPPQ